MIKLASLSAYKQSANTTLVLLGEDSLEKQLPGLPAPLQNQLSALKLKPGHLETVKTFSAESFFITVFGLLPRVLSYDALEELLADGLSALKAQKAKAVDVLVADKALLTLSGAFYKQLALAGEGFDHYQTSGIAPLKQDAKPEEKEPFAPAFTLYLAADYDKKAEEKKLKEALVLADGIRIARRLVNEPANVLSPEQLAKEASLLGKEHGFEVEVYDEVQIQQMGLHAFYSVAKGSDSSPRFIVMRYMNAKVGKHTLALVGKGLTYDSGGYALKPAQGMDTMFCDMGGAAAVIGAISSLAQLKAKVNVVAIVAACENMVSGHAYRNGDIIPSLSGKYIEVVNTDAEGRLTLADAISYAATVVKADQIIDIATLTGAVGVALGRDITGVVADDEGIFQAIQQAADASGDKVWRLPHYEHLAKHNKSQRADIKNSGGRPAGTATAALFCRAFAFGVPWGHLDIAGTAYQDKASPKAPLGATGVGAEILTRAAISLFA